MDQSPGQRRLMHINSLPPEILSNILQYAVALNQRDGVCFTYGVAETTKTVSPAQRVNMPHSTQRAETKYEKYVRGPSHMSEWDAASSIRQVCWAWHEWTVSKYFANIYVRKRTGSEKWTDVTNNRAAYGIYELIDSNNLRGAFVYRDPYQPLHDIRGLIQTAPRLSAHLQRLWINGFYDKSSITEVADMVRACSNLRSVSLSWTAVRYFTANDWIHLLRADSENPLESLELLAVEPPSSLTTSRDNAANFHALSDPRVSFKNVKRLKLFGDTSFMPIIDDDLFAIARSVQNLKEFHLTCISTVTINGVMAVLLASQQTLRVLEHSPRSQAGFDHPHPGSLADNTHICEVLTQCPQLETLSISVPSMCSKLFSNNSVKWKGDCQVRAARLCSACDDQDRLRYSDDVKRFRTLLQAARSLMESRNRLYRDPSNYLTIELFYSDFIFDPHIHSVHGNFEPATTVSHGAWPIHKVSSGKGPYGSSGVYKGEEGVFDRIDETEFVSGLNAKWIRIET